MRSVPLSHLVVTGAALLIAACGGGGGGSGGGGAPPALVSAGPDRTVASSAPVELSATAAGTAGVTAFAWSQLSGLPVELDGAAGATPRFVSPDRDARLRFEVVGRNAAGSVVASDQVTIDVDAVRPSVTAQPLATIEVRGGGAGRATSSALHAATSRLFVVDPLGGDVVVYGVANPSSPTLLGSIGPPDPIPGFDPGPPLAVACGESGPIAITWAGATSQFPGRIQLVDPATLLEQSAVSSFGANPVDVTATPDGSVFAVACAGDASEVGPVDGFAFVTILRIPTGGAAFLDVHSDVSPIPFTTLDGLEDDLEQEGVRWFRASPRASRELVPRSVALSADGRWAWAACPENDALVVVDAVQELAVDCVALDDRRFDTFDGGTSVSAVRARWDEPPVAITTPAGDDVPFGGVTGIASAIERPDGLLELSVVTGAGPVLTPIDPDGNGVPDLPLVDPTRALRVHRIVVDPSTGAVEIDAEITLDNGAGTAVTGAPSQFGAAPGLAFHDESVVDLDGNAVPVSLLGARFTGATTGAGGDLWLAEARRCGLWRFDAQGTLLARFVPEGTPGTFGVASLPPAYARRRANLDFDAGRRFGGFGGLAYDGPRNLVAAAVRLPLDNPDTAGDDTSAASSIARILEVDAASGTVVGEYAYALDAAGHAIEGLATSPSGAFDGAYALLEAALDPAGFRGVYAVDLSGATNLRTLSPGDYASVDAALEGTAPDDLGGLAVPIVPATKTLRVDLTDAGLGGGGRPSGVAALGEDLVVTFDDGAGVEGASADLASGRIIGAAAPGSSVALLRLTPAGIDAASSGSGFAPTALPIDGLVQPLDLATFDDEGRTRVVLANGGLARLLPSDGVLPSFDERARVRDLSLDTTVFPNAASLQTPPVAGDLFVSELDADLDGNGFVDRLQAFGARSIGVRDAGGAPLWSSGERLVARAALESPAAVRASATSNGIEPRAVAVATVAGRRVLVTSLAGAGVVVAHDLADPRAPLFAGVLLGTEAPVDVDVAGSLLATSDSERGRVLLHRLAAD
ncbi:MAG: esterase-like activity of phytase family protein [Planctomycetota bacterium]